MVQTRADGLPETRTTCPASRAGGGAAASSTSITSVSHPGPFPAAVPGPRVRVSAPGPLGGFPHARGFARRAARGGGANSPPVRPAPPICQRKLVLLTGDQVTVPRSWTPGRTVIPGTTSWSVTEPRPANAYSVY